MATSNYQAKPTTPQGNPAGNQIKGQRNLSAMDNEFVKNAAVEEAAAIFR